MDESIDNERSEETTTRPQEGLRTALSWLEAPPSGDAADESEDLRRRLIALRSGQIPDHLRESALDRLFVRSMQVVDSQIPLLANASFPIPRKTRQLVRSLQDLLGTLAENLLIYTGSIGDKAAETPRPSLELKLWRVLRTLSRHLLVSNLTAAPPVNGIWQQLHQSYCKAQELGMTGKTPVGTAINLQSLYYSAVLLGCAQPASFTSQEIGFVADYLELFSDQIDPGNGTISRSPAAFWIDPSRDAPAVPCSRKPPPKEIAVHYFCCDRIAALLRNQLASLESGLLAEQIGLPEFAGTTPGRGILRRLITYWGEPGKRRFPRRRQYYRAVLCSGLGNLWQMFHDPLSSSVETSDWMITNESPDGYAVMHVSGQTGAISVGDVMAIRTETGNSWQVCIVRWALSENQEHLELGLQILATRAVPAILALPANENECGHLSVLVLPEVPPLRPTQMLVVPSGALDQRPGSFVLMVEKNNLEVREVKSTSLDEQNSQVQIFSIESDSMPF